MGELALNHMRHSKYVYIHMLFICFDINDLLMYICIIIYIYNDFSCQTPG